MNPNKAHTVVIAVFVALIVVILQMTYFIWYMHNIPFVSDSIVTEIVGKACRGELELIHTLTGRLEEMQLQLQAQEQVK